MKRYFIETAYKGTNYHGYQIQKNKLSVQERIEKAISTVLNTPIVTKGSSRTDAGVHARQNFAHFDTDIELPEDFLYRINTLFPHDIVVKRIIPVNEEQHARFSATSRSYEYYIHYEKDPFLEEFSYRYFLGKPDIEKMNQAAKYLLKYEDFSCFCKAKTDVKTKICDIRYAKWEIAEDEKMVFYISADRFLRGMVRAVVGTLLRVGTGKYTIQEFEDIIKSKNRSRADFSPPPQGLFLTRVEYPFIDQE